MDRQPTVVVLTARRATTAARSPTCPRGSTGATTAILILFELIATVSRACVVLQLAHGSGRTRAAWSGLGGGLRRLLILAALA
jgi:hypothetical protein